MTQAALLETESVAQEVEQELNLLIREARRRQRRRLISRALGALAISIGAALVVLTAAGADSPSVRPGLSGRTAAQAVPSCPSSAARFVSNSSFAATVFGRGAVRLAIGNEYLKRSRRVVLGTAANLRSGWLALEVIWIKEPSYVGAATIRGTRLGRPGVIDVQSSGEGLTPGTDTLRLPPSSPNSTPNGAQLYPGAIWVRSGGCYAVTVSGRKFTERIVLNAQPHR